MRRSAAASKGVLKRCVAAFALLALMPGCAAGALSDSPQPQDIAIAGSRVFPESVTADAAGNIYIGSIAGTIYRATPGATEAVQWISPDEENGLRSVFGVLADEMHGVLWVCSNPNPFRQPREPGPSALKAFALATGALSASYLFPEGEPTACNDIAVEADGTVYASETASGRIFTLAPGAKELALFAQEKALVGVDGIAFADDGTIYINNVRENLVQRVNRKADGSYAGLTTLTLDDTLNGPDGLRPVGGNRFLQAEGPGGRVALITITGDSATVVSVKTGLASSAGVTRAGKVGYATEGKIDYLIDPALRDKDPGAFVIRAFALPEGL